MPTRFNRRWLAATVVLAAACADQQPLATGVAASDTPAESSIQAFDCVANARAGTVSCGASVASGASRAVFGGQSDFVRLTSSNVTSASGIFSFDVTVQNLLPEQMGTPDGVIVDTAGINVFFVSEPTVTSGTGNATVANEDGQKAFTSTEPQSYFRYAQKLTSGQVSTSKRWQIAFDPGVASFSFRLYVAAELQPLLVINEVLANPSTPNSIADANGEWFEVYNAGRFPVQMQGMVITDSTAPTTANPSGRRPYHRIANALIAQPGGYVVFGNTTNTATNGGVPVDYAYGAALAFGNTGPDAVKVSRVYGTDTLTVDRVAYANGGTISGKDGITRELLNPLLDNADVDGANWGDALATAVYGPGGRGTPKAQNSTFTP